MKRLVAWTRKEVGDHKAILIGIAVAVPVLTAVAFWAFGDLMKGHWPSSVASIFAVGIMVLLWFGVASDLVTNDARRGTVSVARRVPGGLRSAWLAKILFLVGATGVLSLWTATCLDVAWTHVIGVPGGIPLPGRSTQFWFTILALSPLLSWPLLVGTWMGRSGAAGIGAVLLLGVVGAPAWFGLRAHPNVFGGELIDALTPVALWAGVAALFIATLSFLRGYRYRGRGWKPLFVGAPILLVLLGAGIAWGAHKIHRWNHIEVGDSDVSIYAAQMASDGSIWMTVYRGQAWFGGKAVMQHLPNPRKSRPGTPLQSWILAPNGSVSSVDDGRTCIVSRPGANFGAPRPFRSLDPASALWTTLEPEGDGDELTRDASLVVWWDATTRERVATLPMKMRTPATDKLLRDLLRSSTPHRDPQGRRVWMRDGRFERAGEPQQIAEHTHSVANRIYAYPVPGGWIQRDLGRSRLIRTDVEGHTVTSPTHPKFWYPMSVDRWVRVERHGGRSVATIGDYDGGTERVVEGAPLTYPNAVAKDRLLGRRGDREMSQLVLWNPLTGEDERIKWNGAEPEEVQRASPYGRNADGLMLMAISLRRHDADLWQLATLDLETKTATLLSQPIAGYPGHALALMPDGSAIVMEGSFTCYRRIVRYGPALGQQTVLWPRAK